MKLHQLLSKAPSGAFLLVVLAVLFTVGVGPAQSAPEPGTVTIVLAAEPENVDPGTSTMRNVGQVILKNVVEPLVEVNPDDSSITPRLATSWKRVDANTWQFTLRKGVKFHDGKDFDAKVVLFNIERIYSKKIDSKVGTRFFAHFKMEAKALGSHLVEIKTDKPEPLLPSLFGSLAICSPNTPLDKWTDHPMGTGPYKFAKWDQGLRIILERFDGYWGKQPPVKKAVYLWRNESAVRAAMVELGEADLTPDIAVQDAKNPNTDYAYFNSETTNLRVGGAWEPPLNDRRVRMALNYAIDRNAIRGSILSKDVIPATQIVVPSTLGHNPEVKVWPYDPQKAKQLLDEARKDGVPVDKEIWLVARTGLFPSSEELMEAALTMYKAVGFNMKLTTFETSVFVRYRDKPFPTNLGPYILQNQHDNNKGDAGTSLSSRYLCNGRQSVTCDQELDYDIGQGLVSTGETRKKLFQAAFKRIHQEIVPDVMLFHMVGYSRVGKRINFKPSLATTSEIQLAQITFKK